MYQFAWYLHIDWYKVAVQHRKSLVKCLYFDIFHHSRNCYLACFWCPVPQVKVCSARPIKIVNKVSIFCKCSCIYFFRQGMLLEFKSLSNHFRFSEGLKKWWKCISSYKQLVLNHNFIWALTRSNSLFISLSVLVKDCYIIQESFGEGICHILGAVMKYSSLHLGSAPLVAHFWGKRQFSECSLSLP